tara:strand:- start:19171 stop:20271 length:1101 start_codon:yes stop_codon:yes gene_type:complete
MFNNIYKSKKVLITGHTGFKGSWLSLWLLKLDAEVIGFSKDIPSKPSLFKNLNIEPKIKHYIGNINNLDSIQKIIKKEKPDFIFHLAAQALVSVSYSDPIETISTNVLGTSNILESLRQSNHRCIAIIITSDKCYDNIEWIWGYKESDRLGGKDIYSGSKGAAELIFNSYYHSFFKKKESKIKVATVRAGNVIGGGDWAKDRIIPDCMRAWSEKKTVEIRSPNATRPWQHVLEPLSGYLSLAHHLTFNDNLKGSSYNFGPSQNDVFTVKNIIEDLKVFWRIKDSSDAYKISEDITFHEAGLLKLNCEKAASDLSWFSTLDYSQLINFTSSWYYHFYKKRTLMYDFTLSQIDEYQKIAKKKNIKWTL